MLAPLIWSGIRSNNCNFEFAQHCQAQVVQLASGERILLNPESRIFIECGVLTAISPSTVVQLCVFSVSEDVLDWFDLGSAWAMVAFTGNFMEAMATAVRAYVPR